MREVFYKGIGKDRRVGKLSFLEKLRLPQSFAFFFLLCLASTPLFLLWHRRLGHVSSPRLRYFISTGMLGSVPNIEISTCMGCKLGKKSALPFLKTLFLLLLLILCPKPILPLCYRKEDHPYMSFLTEQWKIWLKSRFSVLLLEVNISSLPSELCLLQLTSLTKRFPNDPASTLLSRMELPSGRHILETARSLLLSASVPSQFLAEAVLTAVYFFNLIPSSVIYGLSLFERRFSTPPDSEELRVYRERMWW